MAASLADGITPEKVRTFRTALLRLRRRPELARTLHSRARGVYARVLSGLERGAMPTAGATYFAIGTERDLDAYEGYLREVVDPELRLVRLFARDFWPPPE